MKSKKERDRNAHFLVSCCGPGAVDFILPHPPLHPEGHEGLIFSWTSRKETIADLKRHGVVIQIDVSRGSRAVAQ